MLLKHYLTSLISCLLIFTTFPVASFAASDKDEFSAKDEVIYANLTPHGKTQEMYVVNSFQVTKPGEFIDYGEYENVRNLTNLTDITIKNNNEVHFKAEEDFFYQGTLEKQPLPWNISITYLLDGKKIAPDDLAGANGKLEIQIKTNKNKNVDPVFFEYYLLQISLKFDPLHFDNIQAPKGTEANEGKDKLMSFNVMPDQEEILIVAADVTDFEMDPIDISGVPANIGIDNPDTDELANQMQELSNAIRDINKGVTDLEAGATELNDGASELSKGSNSFLSGINKLNDSSSKLVNGSNEILNVFKQINDVVGDVPEIPSNLDEELNKVPQNLHDLAKELREFSQVINQFDNEIDKLPESALTSQDIAALYAALEENKVDEDIIEMIKQLDRSEVDQDINEVIKQLEANGVNKEIIAAVEELKGNDVKQDITEIIGQLENNEVDQDIIEIIKQLEKTYQAIDVLQEIKAQIPDESLTSIKDMAKELDGFANGLEGAIENISILDELDEFKNGLIQLSAEYQKFHNGLIAYTDGVDSLAKSYKKLNSGTKELADGASGLASGISDLQEGTQELADETSDLSGELESEIDEFMEEFDFSDFEPVSFVSDKNKKVSVVQFVLQTESIEVDEPDDEPKETVAKKNIWDRFLDLFR